MKLLLFTVSVPAVAYLHFHCNCHTSIFLHMCVKFRRILFTSLEFLRPGLAPVPAKHFLLQPRLCDQALLSNTFFKRFYINKNELDGKVVDINQPVELWREQTLLSGDRHVYLVQPVEEKCANEPSQLFRLEESIALVDSIPGWTVVDKTALPISNNDVSQLLDERTLTRLASLIQETQAVTSLFVSVDMLTVEQKQTFSQALNLEEVYDRYSLVLQIFRLRAKTKQAQLQVDLAAIPYIQATMLAENAKSSNKERQGFGGAGETYRELALREFQKKEKRIKQKLHSLWKHRNQIRLSRRKTAVPIVAVVGYTNAGKTSLIKALSKSHKLEPKDQLFATLDVTAHKAHLPNNMRYVLIDTVGFLSDLPHSLIDAFSATMEDMLEADLLIHVRDLSHPDHKNQLKNVLRVLSNLRVNPQLLGNIIEVRNKMDKIWKTSDDAGSAQDYEKVIRSWNRSPDASHRKPRLLPSVVCHASATRERGIENLRLQIQERLMEVTGRREVELTVPADDEHFTWLQMECAVVSAVAEGDYRLRVKIIAADWQMEKFLSRFHSIEFLEGYVPPTSTDKW